ncbi:carboxymuconolactone decarboxylase family protein [Enterovibrio makurazakiensis]|uniref:carboxymuconolactone decarboxylase family protein n=1 Tax=Enterovibrio makurazakiensis TaxID=2910232 RepID=UPI003D1EE45D
MEKSRLESGLAQLASIDGEAGQQVIDSLQDICPDLAKYTIEFPFGDIYSRAGLDIKSREIATVAALTALGHCVPQLKVHLNAALNVGCSEEEIKEVILQMTVYAGFPAALNGMFAFKEVLAGRMA